MRKTYDKTERICGLCENATILTLDGKLLCKKRGIVNHSSTCRKFSFDPFKRIPPENITVKKAEFIDIDAPLEADEKKTEIE